MMPSSCPFEIHTNGKLLISGEYYVLDGALALAVPTKKGQRLKVEAGDEKNILQWQSFDYNGELWFEAKFSLPDFKIIKTTHQDTAEQLKRIFIEARKLGREETAFSKGMNIKTHLEFPREWGLGTSSSLIAGIAAWKGVDPYDLLWNSFGGSGYDIACAFANAPLLFQLKDKKPNITSCNFNPPFKSQLYFVYLGKKQNSRKEIKRYRAVGKASHSVIDQVSELTKSFVQAKALNEFEYCIESHEKLVSTQLDMITAKEIYFRNYPGAVKSLGAWGGDFVMVTSPMNEKETRQWFSANGFKTVFGFDEMVK